MNHFYPASILLPREEDLEKWAVIACDQFTSDPEYWQRVRQYVGQSHSTLHLMLPEAELGQEEPGKIAAINAAMAAYLRENLFTQYPNAYIYVERTLQNGMVRPGLLGMVDLESYDYFPGSRSPIRATEETVLERIPPRQQIRKDAALEFSHILMLCDDDQRQLIEPIAAAKASMTMLYDFSLMEQGGHITGWLVPEEEARAFDCRLAAYIQRSEDKYPDFADAAVLFAVGDGNHSLATAKSCYEALKASDPEGDYSSHPARYALVELENIHDPSLVFEPIHRLVTGVDCSQLLKYLDSLCTKEGFPVEFVTAEMDCLRFLDPSKGALAAAVLQDALDAFLACHPGKLDYIHGDEEARRLGRAENAVAFLLPPMDKGQLFRAVIRRGVLPRKTFSMGHAREKRYYLEGRKIR